MYVAVGKQNDRAFQRVFGMEDCSLNDIWVPIKIIMKRLRTCTDAVYRVRLRQVFGFPSYLPTPPWRQALVL